MKDIHEVQDIQPHTFNRICCRGVAANARNVCTQWARREGPGHTHNPGSPFSRKILLTTRSPHTMPLQHSPDNTEINSRSSMTFHHTMAQLDCAPIPPGSSTSLTEGPGFGGFCQLNGGAWQRSEITLSRDTHTSHVCHINRACEQSIVLESYQKATPNLRPKRQGQCTEASGHAPASN